MNACLLNQTGRKKIININVRSFFLGQTAIVVDEWI